MKKKIQEKPRRVFSENFKKEKVSLIETGQATISEIASLYDLTYQSVYQWNKKYGTLKAGDRIVIEKDSDYQKAKELRKRVDELERFIGRQQIKLDYYETVIQQANEKLGKDLEKDFF